MKKNILLLIAVLFVTSKVDAHCTIFASTWSQFLEGKSITGFPLSRDNNKGHQPWLIHLGGFPDDLRRRATGLIQNAMDEWNSVPNQEYRFGAVNAVEDDGPPPDVRTANHINEIVFDQTGDYFFNNCLFQEGHQRAGHPMDETMCMDMRQTLGITTVSSSDANTWESSILINGQAALDLEGVQRLHFVPSLQDIDTPLDVPFYQVVMHELGHGAGLDHFGALGGSGCGPYMPAIMGTGHFDHLQPEDHYAIQWLYPSKDVFYPPLVVATLRQPNTIRTNRYIIDAIIVGSGDGRIGGAKLEIKTRPEEDADWAGMERGMSHTQSEGPIYSGVIPGQPRGSDIEYRVVAESPDARLSEGREPWPGMDPQYFSFKILHPDPNLPWFEPVDLERKLEDPFEALSVNFVDADFDGDLDLFFSKWATLGRGGLNYYYYRNSSDLNYSFAREEELNGIDLTNAGMEKAWFPFLNSRDRDDMISAGKFHHHFAPGQFRALQVGSREMFGSNFFGVSFSGADLNGDGNIEITRVDYENAGHCAWVPDDQLGYGLQIFSIRGNQEPLTWDLAEHGFIRHDKATALINIGDYDRDGDFDILQSNYCGNTILYGNDGDGHFEDVTQSAGLEGTISMEGNIWIDYNNDGWIDVCPIHLKTEDKTSTAPCAINLGQGTFKPIDGLPPPLYHAISPAPPFNMVALTDYNNDGFFDIVSSHVVKTLFIHHSIQESEIGFKVYSCPEIGCQLGGRDFGNVGDFAMGDYNSDGGVDVAFIFFPLWMNTLDNNRLPEVSKLVNLQEANHWLNIHVRSDDPKNYGGIGSEVIITTHDGGVHTQYVDIVDHKSRDLHFGLGKNREWKTIAIRWADDPMGHIQHVENADHRGDRSILLHSESDWMSDNNLPPKVWFINKTPVSHVDSQDLAVEVGDNIAIKLQIIDPEMDKITEIRTEFDSEFQREVTTDPRGFLTITATGENWGIQDRTITITPMDARGASSRFTLRVRRGNPLPDLVIESANVALCEPVPDCRVLTMSLANIGTSPVNAGTVLAFQANDELAFEHDQFALETALVPQERRTVRMTHRGRFCQGCPSMYPHPLENLTIDTRNVVHEENEANNIWRRE